jgi:ABC-2 type transport system permease protein/ribosome-dependent ATPase
MNLKRVWAVTYKEWREIFRDKLFFAMAFILPVGIFLVLAFGISFDVEKISFAVLDRDGSAMSRDFLHRFMDSRYFDYKGHVQSERELDPLLAHSDIRFAIIIPPRFQEQLLAGQATSVQSLIDGVFPYRAEVAKGYLSAIIANFNAQSLVNYLALKRGIAKEQALSQVQPVRLESRYLYNQALRSQWSISSGLMMLVLMVTPPFLTALGVVREKENGSIYNIYASTITRSDPAVFADFLPKHFYSLGFGDDGVWYALQRRSFVLLPGFGDLCHLHSGCRLSCFVNGTHASRRRDAHRRFFVRPRHVVFGLVSAD